MRKGSPLKKLFSLWMATVALCGGVCISLATESNTRTVQAEFDRCAAQMERVERAVREYDDALGTVRKSIAKMGSSDRNTQDLSAAELAKLESRADYFHNRIERASGQADKVRDDLKNVKGPTCPSCVLSSVNMYCRNTETLLTEIDDYKSKAMTLVAKTRQDGDVRTVRAAGADDFLVVWASIDSTLRLLHEKVDSCADVSGKALWRQSRITLGRADSLNRTGDKAAARTALTISRTLMTKACKVCLEE